MTCSICGCTVGGSGGGPSHGRAHVRRGEAVELARCRGVPQGIYRLFIDPNDTEQIEQLKAVGFVEL